MTKVSSQSPASAGVSLQGGAGAGGGIASYGRPCPVCNGSTNRVHRRLIDLVLSIFTPLRRYRCRSMSCTWEGNLREK
jgi:hypothetical protein